jgi:serine phosphatase RsbU (regulator of sigma subunit)
MNIEFYKEQLQAKEDMLARTTQFLVDVQHTLEEKNAEIANTYKSILDSINVAERIQKSLLPNIDILKLFFKDASYRVIQQIGIGGDSVFIKNINEGIIFGLLDSTGHGIPAAMMSISCTLLLRELISTTEISNPKNLLHLLDYQLFNTFSNEQRSTAQAEGTIFSFSSKSGKLVYSSAKGKAFLSRKSGQIEELAYTRKSIGDNRKVEFQNFEIDLKDADKLFLYSDGLIDQFGGDFGKKFSRIQLKNLFQNNLDKEVSQIMVVIETALDDWKNTTKQTDDISFMIIKF